MQNFTQEMLQNSPEAQKMEALWKEYEEGQTAEARLAKDLDRFEVCVQALEYEKRHSQDLQEFYDSSLPFIRHSVVRQWGQTLLEERARWQAEVAGKS